MDESTCSTRHHLIVVGAILSALAWAITRSSAEGAVVSCEDVCAWNNTCPGAQQVTCSSYCANAASINTASGCAGAYSEYLSCKAQHQTDTCLSADQTCVSALVAYFQCVNAYCRQNPTPTDCG